MHRAAPLRKQFAVLGALLLADIINGYICWKFTSWTVFLIGKFPFIFAFLLAMFFLRYMMADPTTRKAFPITEQLSDEISTLHRPVDHVTYESDSDSDSDIWDTTPGVYSPEAKHAVPYTTLRKTHMLRTDSVPEEEQFVRDAPETISWFRLVPILLIDPSIGYFLERKLASAVWPRNAIDRMLMSLKPIINNPSFILVLAAASVAALISAGIYITKKTLAGELEYQSREGGRGHEVSTLDRSNDDIRHDTATRRASRRNL
ncbi:hypothetical protein J1614_011062 [Plenodomus biglobosus]|nr:hypothetical protein J1614_011062 [Plenodomus biglobosus]